MRLTTFNILHGRSLSDDRVDPARYAEAIASLDADILALQEVDRDQPRSAGADLTAVAAEAMGAPEHRFVAALTGVPGATWLAATGEEQPGTAGYGIALLSRYPVAGWEVIRLPGVPVRVPMVFSGRRRPVLVGDEPRVAVAATVQTPTGDLTVVNTHLSFIPAWNALQLRRLLRALPRDGRPLVLMGDLNMDARRARRTTGLRPLVTELTFPADQPREQLDHILGRGPFAPAAGTARRLAVSDHRALSVDV